MKKLLLCGLALFCTVAMPKSAQARISSGACSDCHTMHNSQGGEPVSGSGPYEALTINSCVGCHTALGGENNNGTGTPYVNSALAPIYGVAGDTLAGGSFYWMNSDKTKGHDVEGIAAAFDKAPPGYRGSSYGRPGSWPPSQQVACAGTYGCHGRKGVSSQFDSVLGGHHEGKALADGSTLTSSYRLLEGVAGNGDQDWEYRPTVTNHNQYRAIHRTLETTVDPTTISYFCGQCHGDFHSGAGNLNNASPWLRHPTDVMLPGSGEYSTYNTDTSYSLVAPVGSETVSSVLFKVDPGTTNCIVTCISCHRAHGSPYYKLMRWDYANWPAAGVNGCATCHTSKN